jgi:hypothetical protein
MRHLFYLALPAIMVTLIAPPARAESRPEGPPAGAALFVHSRQGPR